MTENQNKKRWQQKGAGHRARLRDRYLRRGLDNFTDIEVVELLLSFGTPRSDCKEQAKALIKEYGSFAGVLDAGLAGLQKVKGVGPKNSFAISFIRDVAARYLEKRLEGKKYLTNSKEVVKYLTYQLRGLKKEVLYLIFLDSSHAIISSEIIAEGTINVNTVYPRELIIKALEYNAAALIIAHNHPSGEIKPSKQDVYLTGSLYLLCSTMQISLLDHIIIGNGAFSFADEGLMLTIKDRSKKAVSYLQE